MSRKVFLFSGHLNPPSLLFNPYVREMFDAEGIKMQNTAQCSFFLPCGDEFSVDIKGMRLHLSSKLINCRKISEL
jgi:hypothetical protein